MALYGQADPVSQSAFRDFFGVRLILDYVYSCSETDFYEKKSHFHPTTRIPKSSLLLLLLCHKTVR